MMKSPQVVLVLLGFVWTVLALIGVTTVTVATALLRGPTTVGVGFGFLLLCWLCVAAVAAIQVSVWAYRWSKS